MPRARKQEILHQKELKIPLELIRFATPKNVALYRARRLKCKRITEIGSGIGGQTIAFAKECEKVLCIEINPESLEIAKSNFKKLKLNNIECVLGDALSKEIIQKIKEFKPEIIFCDTERAEQGERTLSGIKPDVREILKNYSGITKRIAIEIPPFTSDLENLKEIFEQEFISLDKKLNRLTLYFNGLKKAEKSCVALPLGERVENLKVEAVKQIDSVNGYEYLYEINPALVLAGLVNEVLNEKNSVIIESGKNFYALSNKKIKTEFLTKYNVLRICGDNFGEIIKNLKEANAKKVILKHSINPEDYWKERKKYENALNGQKEVYLFKIKNEVIISSKE